MRRILSILLSASGFVLLVWRVSAAESISAEMSSLARVTPADVTGWLLATGIVLAVAGVLLALNSQRC